MHSLSNKLQSGDARELVPADFFERSEEEQAYIGLQLAIFHTKESFVQAPFLNRLAVRARKRTSDPQHPNGIRDDWGSCNQDGYWIDCNTSNKSAGKSRRILGPLYNESKNLNGLIQVHVFPHTTKDPGLFTFVGNVAYLPAQIAPLTDANLGRKEHLLMSALQLYSIQRFMGLKPFTGIADVERAWKSLHPTKDPRARQFLDNIPTLQVHEFEGSIFSLVEKRSKKFLSCFEHGTRVTARYHNGVGRIDPLFPPLKEVISSERITELRNTVLSTYPKAA